MKKFPERITLDFILHTQSFDLIDPWLKQGHDIDEISKNYDTYEIGRENNVTLLEYFILSNKISVEEKYKWIEFCLEKGADPNLIRDGECVLSMIHPENVNRRIVQLFLDYGLKVVLRDEEGELYALYIYEEKILKV